MGYPLELFLHPDLVHKEFMCCICHDVLKVPTMSEICEHIYCSSCIAQWTSTTSTSATSASSPSTTSGTTSVATTCPVDRQPFASLRIPIRPYMNMYNSLALKCGFDGCSITTNLDEYESHVKSCRHNPDAVAPCVLDCGAVIKNSQIPTHNCIAYLKRELEIEKSASLSKLRFKFEVSGISKLRDSVFSEPLSFARKLPWRIMLKPKLKSNSKPSYVGFFLSCNADSKSTTWSCHATAILKLLSFNPNEPPYTRRINHTFNSIDYDWGYANFISWAELMNPAHGYVQNDKISLEVVLRAQLPVLD